MRQSPLATHQAPREVDGMLTAAAVREFKGRDRRLGGRPPQRGTEG